MADVALMWHAELAKRGMQERLAVSEDRLMRITRDDTMTSLVHAKLTLAQTDYDNLELQASSSPLHCSATHALLFVLILTMQLQASQLECHARFSPFSGM